MTQAETSGLNAGFVAQMFEAYLDSPASVPAEWRELFEREPGRFAATLPGLAGLLEDGRGNGGATAPPPAPPPAATAPPPAPTAPPPAPPEAPPARAPEPAPDLPAAATPDGAVTAPEAAPAAEAQI